MNLQVPFHFCMKISESSKIAASLRELKNYGGYVNNQSPMVVSEALTYLGLTLEMSASLSLHSGNFSLINRFFTKFLCFTNPLMKHHSLFRN